MPRTNGGEDGESAGPGSGGDEAGRWTLSSGVVAGLLVVLCVLAVGSALGLGAYDALTGHGDWRSTPSATFGSEYDPASGEFTIHHRGGDRYVDENTDRLRIVVTDPRGRTTNHTVSLPFGACDTYAVTAPPGSTVEVVWQGPSLDRPSIPASFEVPETSPAETTTFACPGRDE